MSRRPGRAGELDLIVETVIYLESESRRLARAQSARLGITATQLNVLQLLAEIGSLSLSELSRRLAAQNSSVSGLVDRMVGAGLIVREQSADDRRVWRIRLSDNGLAMARTAEIAPWGILRRALATLDGREKDQLVTILQKVAGHVAREVNVEERRNGVRR
jgi:DNA-binding MarR family transcriptional regulator